MRDQDKKLAKGWIYEQIDKGVTPADLHLLVDEASWHMLVQRGNLLRSERMRADQHKVKLDKLEAELESLRAAVSKAFGIASGDDDE